MVSKKATVLVTGRVSPEAKAAALKKIEKEKEKFAPMGVYNESRLVGWLWAQFLAGKVEL